MKANSDTGFCKERVWKGFHTYRCARTAKKDGYCKQHHPDAVAERKAKSERLYEENLRNSPHARVARYKAALVRIRDCAQIKEAWAIAAKALGEQT